MVNGMIAYFRPQTKPWMRQMVKMADHACH